MVYLGDNQLLAGVRFDYIIVNTTNGDSRKVADAESIIASIQLLSKDYTLALSLETLGKVNMINYSSGNIELLATV